MPLEIKYYTNTGIKIKKLSLTNNPTIIPIIKQSKVEIDPMSWVLLSLSECNSLKKEKTLKFF
ncbi:MAG: hypothetical protein Ct9H300mP2_4330 [Candidatus Neomarinimicrobiota bacterium]|nr:MAG: hypothetical protein Ct9H300mP2_4330 [Candidatus Neomarinimicrobiota bacterium]